MSKSPDSNHPDYLFIVSKQPVNVCWFPPTFLIYSDALWSSSVLFVTWWYVSSSLSRSRPSLSLSLIMKNFFMQTKIIFVPEQTATLKSGPHWPQYWPFLYWILEFYSGRLREAIGWRSEFECNFRANRLRTTTYFCGTRSHLVLSTILSASKLAVELLVVFF